MQAIIQPSMLKGTVQAPASKSSMQRACAAALVLGAKSIIKNPGHSNDDQAALGILSALGCHLTSGTKEITIESSDSFLKSGRESSGVPLSVSCGESGLGVRMFTPILAMSDHEIIINGEGSLLSRPVDFFDAVLPQLGVNISSTNGKLPLKISGPLCPKDITIDGSLSSQFLTGLLFAFASSAISPVSIRVKNLKSRPYIDLTLKVMGEFGLPVPKHRDYEEFLFCTHLPSNTKALPVSYQVESDWSGAAFLLVAGAIAGDVEVKGLDLNSTQGDKRIMEALQECGADMSIHEDEIVIRGSGKERSGFNFDATDCPDLFPPLVALAACSMGDSIIRGTKRLIHKESNRALTLQQEFRKMNVDIVLRDDEMIVKGNGRLQGAQVYSHHDHRIAMACAVAGLNAEGETEIGGAEAINKSYPDFFDHLKKLGARIHLKELINH
jgi:3-phosphoshikimate 1-carboxyvinyltransferase